MSLKNEPNLNGSNTFVTMKICSRQGQFEVMSVNHSARSGGMRIFFFIFFSMKVCCVLSLESSHGGDSKGYTQHTIINIKKANHP